MEFQSSLQPEMLEVLERGGTIVTGNQRAARTLRLAFDRRCREQGTAYWQPPSIFAWETWTGRLWQQLLLAGVADRLLLNISQELHIWQSVIAADPRHISLQTIDSLAVLSSSAWQQLCAYRGQSRLTTLGVSEDTRTFQRWAQAFRARCKSDGYLSQPELEHALGGSADTLPKADLLFAGFDRKTPAQLALIEALRNRGSRVAELPIARLAEQRYVAAAETLDDELRDAAVRVRAFLESNPGARVAIVHPDIAAERGEIDRVFRKILCPELNGILTTATGPYEFSLGQPLAHAAMVTSALSILRFATGPLPIDELSSLLLSPWFSPAGELNARAAFDAHHLRAATLLHPQFSLAAVSRAAETSHVPSLSRQLHGLRLATERVLPEPERQKTYADWADGIRELLRAAGWATWGRETSVEFQTRAKWESALDELATLDFEGTRASFGIAVGQFQSILERTLFAPESRDAPVQIMSPLEAAGSRFDAIFFLRCSDLSWPTLSGTNPLLGWSLQRELRMPGSDPALDMAYAGAITRRLAASTPAIWFSYARQTEDAHQRQCPLLDDLELEHASEVAAVVETAPSILEEVEDPGYIPLAAVKVRGGSSILKNQAACGFRAFAEARLGSKALDQLAYGLDARERGDMVHTAMASLWKELGSQSALRALPLVERRAVIDRAITSAIRHTFKRIAGLDDSIDSGWDSAYLEVQRQRLHRIIGAWLESELQRTPFLVKAVEQKFNDLAFGPLMLDVRVDRVDTLLDEQGNPAGEVLLDYKTGDAITKHWQGERPDDPQLPLYAALSEPGALAGVGFIRLRPGAGMSLAGYANEAGQLLNASVPDIGSVEAQIEEWRRVLTVLAEDFAAGDARVRPKEYPKTCVFCAQRIFCRVSPELVDGATDDDEEMTATASEESYG